MDTISFEKIWEDVDFFQIQISVKTENIQVRTKIYTDIESIKRLSQKISTFPQNSADKFVWGNGEGGDDSTSCVSLEFWCEDELGHILVEVYLELEDGIPYGKYNCRFLIKTEIGLLSSFGKSLPILNRQGVGQRVILNKTSE